MGIGVVVAALKFFFDALKSNQKVVDAFEKVTGTISIVMSEVVTAIINAVEQVSKSSRGFDGTENSNARIIKPSYITTKTIIL